MIPSKKEYQKKRFNCKIKKIYGNSSLFNIIFCIIKTIRQNYIKKMLKSLQFSRKSVILQKNNMKIKTTNYLSDNGYWYLTPDGTWIYIPDEDEQENSTNQLSETL